MVYSKYYVYNVENPEDIKNGGKPNVTQFGPYVYQEYRTKQDIARIGNEKIFYGQYIEYIFDEEETWKSGCYNGKEGEPCSKSDIVQVINAPLILANEIIHSLPKIPLKFKPFTTLPSFLLEIMDILLFDPFWCETQPQRRNQTPHCDDLFYNAAVDDLLWQGHNPGIMKLFFSVLDSFEQIIAELGIDIKIEEFLPMQLSGKTLGFYKGKNQTKLGNYRMINNGNLIHEKYLNIEELNGKSELPENWWPHIAPTPSAKDSGIKGNYSFQINESSLKTA